MRQKGVLLFFCLLWQLKTELTLTLFEIWSRFLGKNTWHRRQFHNQLQVLDTCKFNALHKDIGYLLQVLVAEIIAVYTFQF